MERRISKRSRSIAVPRVDGDEEGRRVPVIGYPGVTKIVGKQIFVINFDGIDNERIVRSWRTVVRVIKKRDAMRLVSPLIAEPCIGSESGTDYNVAPDLEIKRARGGGKYHWTPAEDNALLIAMMSLGITAGTRVTNSQWVLITEAVCHVHTRTLCTVRRRWSMIDPSRHAIIADRRDRRRTRDRVKRQIDREFTRLVACEVDDALTELMVHDVLSDIEKDEMGLTLYAIEPPLCNADARMIHPTINVYGVDVGRVPTVKSEWTHRIGIPMASFAFPPDTRPSGRPSKHVITNYLMQRKSSVETLNRKSHGAAVQ